MNTLPLCCLVLLAALSPPPVPPDPAFPIPIIEAGVTGTRCVVFALLPSILLLLLSSGSIGISSTAAGDPDADLTGWAGGGIERSTGEGESFNTMSIPFPVPIPV